MEFQQRCVHGQNLRVNSVQIKTLWDSTISVPVPVSPENKEHVVVRLQNACKKFVRNHSNLIRMVVIAFCVLSYLLYLGFAVKYSLELAAPLLIVTGVVCALMLYTVIRDECGERIYSAMCVPASAWIDKQWYWLKW